jgi:SPP1 gp7 family putative phage head morphogenesis protein
MPETTSDDKPRDLKKPAMVAEEENPVAALIDSKDHTIRETATDPVPMMGPWNTDDLYRKKYDYSIYEDMMKDDQISICMQIKKDLVIGNGWEIKPSDDEQEDICAELDAALRDYPECNLEDRVMEIMTAYDFGFSVTEKQFTLSPKGGLCLKTLKTRAPISWLFHQDKFGNVTKYEQQGATEEFQDVDPNALIHFVNNEEFGNPYGKSDLRVAYLAWFTKQQIVKFYAIYLEKAASPIPVAKYDRALGDDPIVQKIHNSIKRFQAATALTIPKDFEVEFLQAGTVGETYKMAIELFNMFIGRALFVPDLLGFQGAETAGGSYALGKDQILLFMRHINKRRRTIEGLINKHLVKPMVMWNYGDVEKMPQWKLLPINEEQATEYAKIWLELVSKASHKPSLEEINYFKRCINFPETSEEEWEEQKAEEEAQKQAEHEAALSLKLAGSGNAPGKVPPGNKPGKYSKEDEEDANAPVPKPSEKAAYAKKDQVGDFHKKTDFRKIESALDTGLSQFLAAVTPAVKEALDEYVEEIRRSGGALSATTLKPLPGRQEKIRGILKTAMLEMYQKGTAIAQTEVDRRREDYAVLPPDDFIRVLEAENTAYIGDWEYKVSQAGRTAVLQAIKEGKPISEVTGVIHREGMELSRVSMERYAETKFTEVMNAARLAHFEATGIVDAYQVSAILDGKTSEICRGLHGRIFLAKNVKAPPYHFRCRTMLVPITRFEDFKADDQAELQRFIEENKGKGF